MIYTKEALGHYKQYLNSSWKNIWQAYENPSYNKEKAWSYCEQLCRDCNGYNLKVISKNTFQFTAGFEFLTPDGFICFCFITRKYDKYCKIPEREVM